MSPTRAAMVTGSVIFVLMMLLGTWGSESFWAGLEAAAFLGLPLVVAGGVVAYKLASAPPGRDRAERLLGLVTSSRGEWDLAMRAELASIDDPRERRRFARGCLMTTLKGAVRNGWPVVITAGIVVVIGTLITSRVSLVGQRSGILVFTIYPPALILFVVSLVRARATGSFRTGVVVGTLALAASLAGVFGVALIEANQWYQVAGVYIMDGDGPKPGLEKADVIRDAVSPNFMLFHLLIWAPWPVLGAAAGGRRRRNLDELRSVVTAGL